MEMERESLTALSCKWRRVRESMRCLIYRRRWVVCHMEEAIGSGFRVGVVGVDYAGSWYACDAVSDMPCYASGNAKVLEKVAPSSSSDLAKKSDDDKVSRELFPSMKKKISKNAEKRRSRKAVALARKFAAKVEPHHSPNVSETRDHEEPASSESFHDKALVLVDAQNLSLVCVQDRVSILTILEISESSIRFAFEGKVLNRYGTFKYASGPKILKAHLADAESCDTITLVISGNSLFRQFEKKIVVGEFIRIEGPVARKKHQNDGGSSLFSLHLDATSSIIKGEPFDVCLTFVPDIKIQDLLAQSITQASAKTLLGTIAFVVLEVEKAERPSGESSHQFIVVDGPTNLDRATLSFVNDRRDDCNALAAEFKTSGKVMYVARNAGVWAKQSNTLSVLDLTLLTRVTHESLRDELEEILNHQISALGLANEISGVLQVTNVNSILLEFVCPVCRCERLSRRGDIAYCHRCSKNVEVL